MIFTDFRSFPPPTHVATRGGLRKPPLLKKKSIATRGGLRKPPWLKQRGPHSMENVGVGCEPWGFAQTPMALRLNETKSISYAIARVQCFPIGNTHNLLPRGSDSSRIARNQGNINDFARLAYPNSKEYRSAK